MPLEKRNNSLYIDSLTVTNLSVYLISISALESFDFNSHVPKRTFLPRCLRQVWERAGFSP